MRIVLSDFMSLDGVVQAPGGRDEDRDGGFAHGGWCTRSSTPTYGSGVRGGGGRSDGLLFGRRTYEGMAVAGPIRRAIPSPTT